MSSGVLDPNVLIFVQNSPVFPIASARLHRGLQAQGSRLQKEAHVAVNIQEVNAVVRASTFHL
jgi:hypothetical protein